MTQRIELRIPDLGDFSDVEVIEVLVAPGDAVAVEAPLVSLETDKASIDVPASEAGTIVSLSVQVGDRVNSGDVVAIAEPLRQAASADDVAHNIDDKVGDSDDSSGAASAADHHAQLVVIGAGPGGYTAAFRAADLGLDVILIERYPTLGGVCLNVGCIPSKALLHAAKVIDDARAMAEHGVAFGPPSIDAQKLRDWKNRIVERLTGGLSQLAQQRKLRVLTASVRFAGPKLLTTDTGETLAFDNCIVAAGSEPLMLPDLPDDPRIVDSTGALELHPLPRRLLVVGGGIIGLEMACVYAALGTAVSVVELTASLMPGTDPDLIRPFLKVVRQRYEAIMTGTRVTAMRATAPGIEVSFEADGETSAEVYDRVLVAVGRRANGDKLAVEKAGVRVDERGIIAVDKQMRSNVPHIFAIGDLAGGPMLAHKASYEAKVAAEVVAGEKRYCDARAIPSVAYTDPEIAWVGLTELEAKAQGIAYDKAQFPWAASGRSLALGRDEGFTKILFDPQTGRVLGGAVVGPMAGDLIAELGLAVEMGADAADISLTIHPHPTLSETIALSAEAHEGTLTDLYLPNQAKRSA